MGIADRFKKASKCEYAQTFAENDNFEIKEYIDTGNYIFNCLISSDIRKGIPAGRIIQFAGPESVGKSYLSIEAMKNAQKAGYFIIMYDTEFAHDKQSVIKRGIDPDNFLYIPMDTVEKLKTSILNVIEEAKDNDKIMIVIDSIGNLSTTKELEDSTTGSDKKDMTRPAQLKALFRTCTIKAGLKNIPIIVVNHVYACGTENNKVLMGDMTVKSLKDVQKGDIVQTLNGSQEVLTNVKYDDVTVYKLTLEDYSVLEFTNKHKFLVEDEENDIACKWKEIIDLRENDEILINEEPGVRYVNLKKIKIKSIEKLEEKTSVYDIETPCHNYILSNGVVSHNTIGSFFGGNTVGGGSGSLYASSTIIELSKAQDKDSSGVVGGAIISAKNIKSRMSREKTKVKMKLSFDKGLDRYSGLIEFAVASGYLKDLGRKRFEFEGEKYSEKTLTPEIWEKILNSGFDKWLSSYFQYQSELSADVMLDDVDENGEVITED